MRKQIAAANWKMNLTSETGTQLLKEILNTDLSLTSNQEVVFGVPFPFFQLAKNEINQRNGYFVAAQNCSTEESGAFTGEVSANIIKSFGVEYVILGHSERREYFLEDSKTIAAKIHQCFNNGLKPIFCCGEPLIIRTAETQNEYVENQIKECLFHLDADALKNFVVAYEPIWAIGTGKTATADQAQEMHQHIRNVFKEKYGEEVSETISILYGGSVKANNAKEIFGKKDVDGGLVGGASLKADEFIEIIKSLKNS